MAKNVFQPMEIVDLTAQKFKVEPPLFQVSEPVKDLEVYEGPTADDLRREAEIFKASWIEEKARMMREAEEEAEEIRKNAEISAREEVQEQADQILKDREAAEKEYGRLRSEAEAEAARILEEAETQRNKIFEEARREGLMSSREEGWKEGHAEATRLVERLHKILDAAIEKRRDIINEAEKQLIDLVLLVVRKIVKTISENQKNVVINNIVGALKKLKSRGDVSIRVNLADLELSTEHVNDFMAMVEGVKSITVLEDSSVDRGGAIIETDFGQIDTRIASQLREIEEKILELTPVRSTGEV